MVGKDFYSFHIFQSMDEIRNAIPFTSFILEAAKAFPSEFPTLPSDPLQISPPRSGV